MNEFNKAKQDYLDTPIPEELASHVEAGIWQGRENYRKNRRSRYFRRSLGGVAACFVVLVGTLNLSPTVAAAAAEVPVLGGLFQVLTVRSFTDTNADRTLEVEQPAIQGDGEFTQRVNEEIQRRVDQKITEGNQLVEEYKEAFLSTGGTQEEWEAHGMGVSVTYEIKSQREGVVSFLVEFNVSFTNAYWERAYYNLDLTEEKELTLADVLGEDWVSVCNESIRTQMAAAEDPTVYFDESMGGFSSVDETTLFYLNGSGDPVVVFEPYAVAPGVLGYVEFIIAS
ncbi:anti-sigma-V factor rsiV [uncultured Dysosmobacter sp.]|uniref:anti-sigma-V factor rsiV n=1 Tax=uncultured Dysosmobacter sp. TaxID=2591384 RepID=UPI00260EBD59|nr:anti-sigma-V factor rsiV [uncultured Dysosmobacter sp.]